MCFNVNLNVYVCVRESGDKEEGDEEEGDEEDDEEEEDGEEDVSQNVTLSIPYNTFSQNFHWLWH